VPVCEYENLSLLAAQIEGENQMELFLKKFRGALRFILSAFQSAT
jgi:hypothetical protein